MAGEDELAHAVFQSNAAAESFEVGAERFQGETARFDEQVEASATTTDFAPPISADLGIDDREFRAVDVRTNVTAADLSPACEIDAETAWRLRDFVSADTSDFAAPQPVEPAAANIPEPAWGDSELEDVSPQLDYGSDATAADSRQIPPGEDWALAAPVHFETSGDTTSSIGETDLDNSALNNTASFDASVDDIAPVPSIAERNDQDESSDTYEVEIVRDPWSESASVIAVETSASGSSLTTPSPSNIPPTPTNIPTANRPISPPAILSPRFPSRGNPATCPFHFQDRMRTRPAPPRRSSIPSRRPLRRAAFPCRLERSER